MFLTNTDFAVSSVTFRFYRFIQKKESKNREPTEQQSSRDTNRREEMIQTLWSILVAFIRSFFRISIPDPENHVVLITGCDSGFGLLTTHKLLKKNYFVVPLCLTEKGVKELQDYCKVNGCASRSLVLRCDVTKEDQIKAVHEEVEKLLKKNSKLKLWAIVNNAGIAPGGYTDWLSMNTYRKTMDVNFFAIVSVTKTFLQMLKRAKYSRVINICSIAGLSGFPNGGPYCASKHAVEGFTKSVRMELIPWNIFVCNINPGFMK
jgi:NAD(P)-dependent dehydrogenase (short-subunit alcohol dehydrogenase family)